MKLNFSFKLRLYKKIHFQNVFKNGKKIVNKRFAVFFCANQLQHPRIGIVVSRKNISDAVTRNCFKRVVREAFRVQQYNIKANDIIILAYRDAAKATKQELRECIDMLWLKLQKTK